jgi:streptogrisin C
LIRDAIATAGLPVTLVEGRPLSWLELEARSQELHARLGALGFRDAATAFDETTSTVEGVATRVPGGPGTPEQVLALLPEHLRDARLALIDAPATRDFHTYGGNWVRDGNVNECTSGWSVTDGVDDGITTAGHCNGIDEIREPGNPDFPLTWQAQHTTTYGDVEWHTSTHFAPPQFYAASGDLRDVDSVEPRVSITVGEVVCGYGRASNLRVCDEVLLTSVTCGTSQRLVAMENQDVLTNGDSGGGWSFSTEAYGSVKGACIYSGAWRDVWSVADLYDEALGVTVITT